MKTQGAEVDKALSLAVVAIVRRDDGRYLMVQRAPGIRAAGYWTPVSGRPEAGEALPQAALREVAEEVGLRVVVGEELLRCQAEGGAPYFLVWYAATPVPGTDPDALCLDAAEVAQACWLTAAQAAGLTPMFDSTRRFFEERA